MNQGKHELPVPSGSTDPRIRIETRRSSVGASFALGCDRGDARVKPQCSGAGLAGSDRIEVGRIADLLIRAIGVLGIGLSASACHALYQLLHRGAAVDPTIGQYVLATATFLGASVGSGLLVLGRRIHDRIEVAERWRRRG